MSYEHKLALERIVTLCQKSTMPTKRIERVMDIALEALGLTANQRELEIRTMVQTAWQRRRDLIEERKKNKACKTADQSQQQGAVNECSTV